MPKSDLQSTPGSDRQRWKEGETGRMSDRPNRPRRSIVPSLRRFISAFAPFLGLAIVLIFFHSRRPDAFLTSINLKIVAAQTVIVAICAIGMTFIMIGGGIDL